MYGYFAVDSEGLSGGVGLFWTTDVNVDLLHYSKSHIDVRVNSKEGDTRS
uniref:Uncharacterized protein n=1 Tax=Arundo donax TaxID=35708 RepID=A0A0A8ZJ88_ARUDO